MSWIITNMLNMIFVAKDQVDVTPPSSTDLGLHTITADDNFLKNILSIVFGLAAALAVLIIVIAGLTLAKSDGNPEEISKAKKTIIFALVGLGLALSAEAIINVVLGRL